MEITKGTKGALLKFTIIDKNGPVNLIGATVEVIVQNGLTDFTGVATITNETTGVCSMELGDFFISDNCYAQTFVNFGADKAFPSDIQSIRVNDSLKG